MSDETSSTGATQEVDVLAALKAQIRAEVEVELQESMQALEAKHQEARGLSERWYSELCQLRSSITETLREYVKSEDISLDAAKAIASDLGAKEPTRRFSVTVNLVATVEGIEAEHEEDAQRQVEESLRVSFPDLEDYEEERFEVDRVEVEDFIE